MKNTLNNLNLNLLRGNSCSIFNEFRYYFVQISGLVIMKAYSFNGMQQRIQKLFLTFCLSVRNNVSPG